MSDPTTRKPRVAILCDLPEENWHSMDLVAEMLAKHLRREHAPSIHAESIRPRLKRRFARPHALAERAVTFNADRLVNRFWDYPRLLRRERERFDLFHLVDHSYAQLVHELPPERTLVTCHDLDTFRSVLEPERERRSKPFVMMTKKILEGLKKAAHVTCDSTATRDELLKHGLVPLERTSIIHNGVHPSCSPEPDVTADALAARLLGAHGPETIDILHVGSCIERKRIDILLRVFAAIRNEFPAARLVRAGGEFNAEQTRLVAELGLEDAVLVLPKLERNVLSAIYRRAALVLLPSEREGFGLPVIEALACGSHVVASDLAVLREVGGSAASYCPIGGIEKWSETAIALLNERRERGDVWAARREAGFAQASKFSWSMYAAKMVALYRELWYS